MAYDAIGTPREGAVRLAGYVPGAAALKFFKDEQEAVAWLTSPLNGGDRQVLHVQFGPVTRCKLVVPPAPYLEME